MTAPLCRINQVRWLYERDENGDDLVCCAARCGSGGVQRAEEFVGLEEGTYAVGVHGDSDSLTDVIA